ncbi:hypothetical protein PEC302110_16530 [Pectobacterium araliae]|uniref:Uncharacterized protein n=1 Tax=Pectobacterium araliae TaxID=3073862 RepID=A0AAN0MKN8_9GAMM|nr:hypothetical protein PEC302110_16530 [Pectobacterium sp. MAFF 302110]
MDDSIPKPVSDLDTEAVDEIFIYDEILFYKNTCLAKNGNDLKEFF